MGLIETCSDTVVSHIQTAFLLRRNKEKEVVWPLTQLARSPMFLPIIIAIFIGIYQYFCQCSLQWNSPMFSTANVLHYIYGTFMHPYKYCMYIHNIICIRTYIHTFIRTYIQSLHKYIYIYNYIIFVCIELIQWACHF